MSDSKAREHNQGNQNRAFTKEQKVAVDRVRACKTTDYYAILDIEKTVTEAEIKKAYRRLALVMHPDKNGAPGADEAFKLVSKAFQVLSDPQKRDHFDKFGGDPDSRGGVGNGGGGGGGGGNPFAGFSQRGSFAEEMSPEDLFNMFFGGGGGPFGGGGGPFGGSPFGEFVSFGGPGIRVHQFGGNGPRRRRQAQAGAAGAGRGGAAEPQEEASALRTFMQLLPLLLLFILPVISSLISELGAGSTSKIPDYRFEKIVPFTEHRTTPRHRIPYWVNPKDVKRTEMSNYDLGRMDSLVENRYVDGLRLECRKEEIEQRKELEGAMGWFWADREKAEKARRRPLVACKRLHELREPRL